MVYTNQNGWYECQCCPYGYHIDLDFVRYCETLSGSTAHEPSVCGGSTRRRRQDRRRQRQSMEVLLGLVPNDNVPVLPTVSEQAPPTSVDDIRNSLNDVVQEFELTLQRTKGKRNLNLPDVTAVTVASNNNHIEPPPAAATVAVAVTTSMAPQQQMVQQPDERDFDAISIESATNLSPGALQNIRTQMALSLERTRHLEDLVKGIPALQDELDELKNENARLGVECRYWENAARQPQEPPTRPPLPQNNARDVAVLASVLTRTVSVGSHVPLQRTTSTQTRPPIPDQVPEQQQPACMDHTTQTTLPKRSTKDTQVSPKTISRASQSSPLQVSVAVSDDTIVEEECARCRHLDQDDVTSLPPVQTVSVAIGTDQLQPKTRTVSIAIGTSEQAQKTQASQATAATVDKAQQAAEQKTFTAHKMSQSDNVTSVNKHTQHKPSAQSKAIQTIPAPVILQPPTLELTLSALQASQQIIPVPSRIPVPRTPPAPPSPTVARAFRRQDTYTKLPTDDKSAIGLSGLDLGCEPTSSKSSRSLSSSTTIIEQQESSSSSQSLPTVIQQEQLSSIEPVKSNAASTTETKPPEVHEEKATSDVVDEQASSSSQSAATFEKFEQKFILPKVIASSPKPPQEPTVTGQPSREMQAAVKVLNDSLERGNAVSVGAPVAPHLRTAHQLIEREWFRVSSLVGADPLHVEAYLDHLDAVGGRVLEYVVNMVDSSGNTAMHYSVSHGNFDVVSILLDSKVCDVNRQNLAGYTSLMLVSLAEVRSSTHASVVRRLFSLGDVNVRARGHGQTALMLAVSHGRGDMVAMLLAAGADVNIQDDDGSTALMCAAEHGHVEIVRQFLAQPDCDSRVTDVDGCTALRIAMDAGHRHIGVLLYAHERKLLGPAQSASGSATPSRRRSNSGTSTPAAIPNKRDDDA